MSKIKEKIKEEKTTKATEGELKEEKAVREEERDACNREIAAVLSKYGCEMTAQVIVGENRIVPQVFIIDART